MATVALFLPPADLSAALARIGCKVRIAVTREDGAPLGPEGEKAARAVVDAWMAADAARGEAWELVAEFECDVPTRKETNSVQHWSSVHARRKVQHAMVGVAMARHVGQRQWTAPRYRITLTRLGGRTLDTDGLAASMKGVQDSVARYIGIDDGDPRLLWMYAQEPSPRRKRLGLRVKIEAAR